MTVLYAGLGWILLFGVAGLIWWILSSSSRKAKVVASAKSLVTKKKDDGHHAPAAKPAHDAHHASGGHGDHGHSKEPGWKSLLMWSIGIAVLICVLWFVVIPFGKSIGLGQIPGADRDVRRAHAERSGTLPRTSVEAYVRKAITAPPQSGSYSSFVDVPSGYHPLFCEADESLACRSTESDISKVAFTMRCKNLRGEVLDWTERADLIACQVRAKGDTPLQVAYWLEPD